MKIPIVTINGGVLIPGRNDLIRGYILKLKSKKLAKILKAVVQAKKSQKNLRFLQNVLIILNGLLTTSTGFRIAVGGHLSYIEIILIAFPSTIGGFILGMISQYPIASALLPLVIVLGRDIEDISNPYEKCRISSRLLRMPRMPYNFLLIKYLCFAPKINFH